MPATIQKLMSQRHMEEAMRRMRQGEVAMIREKIRVMAAETKVFVATMEASDRMANVFVTPP